MSYAFRHQVPSGALILVGLAILTAGPAFTQGFELAAPVCKMGACSGAADDPACFNPVLLYKFAGMKPATPIPSIPGDPPSLIHDPCFAAYNRQGELFVGNRQGNATQPSTISRFKVDQKGNQEFQGRISGNGLSAVHGIAFSPKGELFACNYFGGISRFTFDHHGNPVPNGGIPARCMGLAFDRKGELFVTQGYWGYVERYLFDSAGAAVPNGSFEVPGMWSPHGLAFNVHGELFIADLGFRIDYPSEPVEGKIFRVLFDRSGKAVLNGSFVVPGAEMGMPISVAFSPPGELFVGCHFPGNIYRFLFDNRGNPVPNGSLEPNRHIGGIAIWP